MKDAYGIQDDPTFGGRRAELAFLLPAEPFAEHLTAVRGSHPKCHMGCAYTAIAHRDGVHCYEGSPAFWGKLGDALAERGIDMRLLKPPTT